MRDNARKRIKIQINKREKTKEPVLQRAKKLERVLYTNWLARARRKGHDNQRK